MSKVTPYPLRIVKCAKSALHKPAKKRPPAGKQKHPLLRGKRGDGFPLTIAVTLCLLLIFCGISEYFRVTIIAQGVRDAVQQSVISTVNDNFDEVYHSVREGYAAGYFPTEDESWEESLDTGNIYAQLATTLGLTSTGSGYASYAGEKLEYTISALDVTLSNNGLASGESEGYLADATLVLEVPSGFAGRLLPPVRMLLKMQAKYIPKF
ncbi:MAG: hypothetical protein RR336_03395 [Oscillospiraceae bacterium]